MVAQEALEVEDGQLLACREVGGKVQQLGQLCIRIDVVALHEGVLLRIASDLLGHLRAAHLGVSGVAKEDIQLRSDLLGHIEHRGALGRIGVSRTVSLAVLAALAGILDSAVDLLLQALDLSEEAGDGVAHRGQVANQATQVIIPAGLYNRISSGRRLRDRGGGNRRS